MGNAKAPKEVVTYDGYVVKKPVNSQIRPSKFGGAFNINWYNGKVDRAREP